MAAGTGRTWVAALLVALVAAVIGNTGCSGEAEPEPGASPGTAARATAERTTRVDTVTPTQTQTQTQTPRPVMVSPTVLDSYRYAIALSVAGAATDEGDGAGGDGAGAGAGTPDFGGADFRIEIDGEVVNPDRERSHTRASLGFIELALERVQIGDRAWTREAGGEWKTATPGSASPAIGGDLEISPARIFAEGGSALTALNDQLRTIDFTTDEVDGLAAHRYALSAEQFQSIFGGEPGLLPGDSEPLDTRGTLWVSEELRVPLRIQLTSTTSGGDPAFEMDLSLHDVNEPIMIEPPL